MKTHLEYNLDHNFLQVRTAFEDHYLLLTFFFLLEYAYKALQSLSQIQIYNLKSDQVLSSSSSIQKMFPFHHHIHHNQIQSCEGTWLYCQVHWKWITFLLLLHSSHIRYYA